MFSFQAIYAQQEVRHPFTLTWSPADVTDFPDAGEYSNDPRLPLYTYRFPLQGKSEISASVVALSTDQITLPAS